MSLHPTWGSNAQPRDQETSAPLTYVPDHTILHFTSQLKKKSLSAFQISGILLHVRSTKMKEMQFWY